MSNNAQDDDEIKEDTETDAPEQVEFAVMKNPHIIIIGICDYDAPNHALPAVKDDIRKMKDLWKTKFKYPNLSIKGEDGSKVTASELGSFLNDESSKIQLKKQVDGLIIVYSGHGANDGFGENYVVGSNNGRLSLTTIQEKFDCEKCDYLKGKPKILYFDCCRGEEKIENEEIKQRAKGNAAKKQYINNLSDFMMHYATSQNYVSWSNQDEGGHLISAIYKCYTFDFDKHKTTAITLHETSMKLNQMVSVSNKGKQTAEIVTRLTYDVYVKPFEAKNIKDDVASRPVLLKMLTTATKQSKDYPALKLKHDELEQKYQDVERKEAEYKKQIRELRQSERKSRKKIQKLESEVNGHDASDETYEQEIETLTDTNTELKRKFDALTAQNNELKQQHKQLNAKHKQLNAQHNELKEQHQELKEQDDHESKRQFAPPAPPAQQSSQTPRAPPPVDFSPIPNPEIIQSDTTTVDEVEIVDTWQDKEAKHWNCSELYSWIKSLDLPNNEVSDLLSAVARTETTGKQFVRLSNGKAIHDRFVEEGFEIDANIAAEVAEQLPRPLLPSEPDSDELNSPQFRSDKPMEQWDCDELVRWIRSLNISEGHKDIVAHTMDVMECIGSDLAECQSAQEVLESFDEIDENVATVIFEGIEQMKNAYY